MCIIGGYVLRVLIIGDPEVGAPRGCEVPRLQHMPRSADSSIKEESCRSADVGWLMSYGGNRVSALPSIMEFVADHWLMRLNHFETSNSLWGQQFTVAQQCLRDGDYALEYGRGARLCCRGVRTGRAFSNWSRVWWNFYIYLLMPISEEMSNSSYMFTELDPRPVWTVAGCCSEVDQIDARACC